MQDGGAYWAHVGDSRIYQLRAGAIKARTRDHSHVELLLREGLIAEGEMRNHPMRNFVECCLGGDVPLPDMSVTARLKLEPGDVLLVCTDGLWSGLEDADFAAAPPGAWLLEHVAWTEAETRISAMNADAEIARILALDPAAACLVVDRRTWRGPDHVTRVRQVFPGEAYDLVARFGPGA